MAFSLFLDPLVGGVNGAGGRWKLLQEGARFGALAMRLPATRVSINGPAASRGEGLFSVELVDKIGAGFSMICLRAAPDPPA
jgi:hypothetical protein